MLPFIDSLINTLQNCGKSQGLWHARHWNTHICSIGLESFFMLANHLVQMFVECGSVLGAQQAFAKLAHRNEYSWTFLISGYIEFGELQHAFDLYRMMQDDHVNANDYTYVALLKACSRLLDVEMGRQLHMETVEMGMESDIFIGSTLVDMYAKYSLLVDARCVFERLSDRDVVLWNALIADYAEHGLAEEAFTCFEDMQVDALVPDDVTFICILKACTSVQAKSKGQLVVGSIVKQGLELNLSVGNAMIDMYTKCGLLHEALWVFDKMSVRDIVTWTALIGGCAEQGFAEEALSFLGQMQHKCLTPVVATFASSLKACSIAGALEAGREIHAEVVMKHLERDVSVGNALVDLYASCGSLGDSCSVFDSLLDRDVVSWSSLIKAYGENHEGKMAIRCFKDMQAQGIKPDAAAFTCLLVACSQSNLVLDGWKYFVKMKDEFQIEPRLDHYMCLVDLIARSGCLYGAERFAESMQCLQNKEVLTALLAASRVYSMLVLGQRCFQQLVHLNLEDSAAYMLITAIYASVGRGRDVTEDRYKDSFCGNQKACMCVSRTMQSKIDEELEL